MKKKLFPLLFLLSFVRFAHAQSKVFKEVSEDISSQMKVISQDGALVGYLVFTQLEKASADSFNYKISIMDENLNDIGTIKFREQKLSLHAVSFEQDVLCLAYLKSNIIGNEFNNKKEYNNAIPNARTSVFTQFLSLNGKIIKSNSTKVDIKLSFAPFFNGKKVLGDGKLKQAIQLRNIPQKGFACFYGDDAKKNLLVFNPAGNQTWQKAITEDAEDFGLLTSNQDVYVLLKKKEKMLEGGFELLSYNTKDSTTFPKYILKDKKGNSLKVLSFDNDPSTGKPYISGIIINPDKGNKIENANQLARGPYSGVFTIDFNGHKKADLHEVYTYWDDGTNASISKNGKFAENKAYARFNRSFKDYQGNTYFVGSSMIKRIKWVSVGFTIATTPLFLPPLMILMWSGSQKAKVKDAVLIKQNAKGALSFENSIPANNSKFWRGMVPFSYYDNRGFYSVSNSETKTNYLIVDDVKDIVIYNVSQKKIVRTIPHKDGNILTSIFPAKEGHVMVSEINKKEKYTRYSIESL